MNLPTEIFGNVVVIHSPEELAADQSEAFQNYLTSQERQNVVLDLDNSESIASEGLAALLDAQTKLRELTGDLKIATTNSVNRKILEITRLDEHLEVFESVIDAVKSFR
ncbi:MAG TPA: STAS domain-containing protein [Pirellulales bacterium]|jgi:anti-sigma B factor antagonist|nr:STAS domain-containing protein [Pirellulales bacterium]